MGFSQIVGHPKQLEVVRQALNHGRLHHAYLFTGMEGVGKRTVALALAKAIHCSAANGDFCGECADCMRIQGGNHPDVRIVGLLPGKKEISIQQIRELEKELNFRSFSGQKKIAVLDPATLMNLSAQNALLKTLEEPPQESLLILIASNGGALLPTLRSRCLRVSFGPLARELVSGFLISHKDMDGETAEFLAAMSLGSLGAAVSMERQDLLERRREWIRLVCSLRGGDYRAASDAAEILSGSKEDCIRFLQWVESWFRDLLAYGVTRNPQDVINLDMLPQIQRQLATTDFESLFARIDEAKAALEGIQRNLNRRLILEDLLLNTAEAS
jgi:DNA polymerase-3 subunit delta'